MYEDGVIWRDKDYKVTDKDKAYWKEFLKFENGEMIRVSEIIPPKGPNPFRKDSALRARAYAVLAYAKALHAATKEKEEGEWITVKGSPVFIPTGTDKGKAISDHFAKSDKGPARPDKKKDDDNKKKDNAKIPYETAARSFRKFLKTNKLVGYTFDPGTGKGYDIFNEGHRKDLLKKYTDGKNSLFIIGTTNHQGVPARRIHSAYEEVQGDDKHAFFGGWSKDGFTYVDTSYPLNHGTTPQDVEKLRTHYAQEQYIQIDQGGEPQFLPPELLD